jgi:NAD+ synthase
MMNGDRACAIGRIEQMIRYTFWSSGQQGIVIGISGGIDSAVSAAFCCKALGNERILGLTLPTTVTADADIEDARLFCRTFGIEHHIISIDPILDTYRAIPGFVETPYLIGNLMARTRMAILYYHANWQRRLVCGTSNRTEYLLGYCTKFGDNAADLQPILHLYKTEIYECAHDLAIPETITRKAPSAGLFPGQSDESEIGLTYPEIDTALRALEKNGWKSTNPLEERVLTLVKKSEHKRISAPNLLGIP